MGEVDQVTLGDAGASAALLDRPVLLFQESRLEITPAVLAFSAQHGLLQHLQRVSNLIERCFPSVQALSIQLEEDPETGEQSVVFDILTRGTIREVLDQYQDYTRQLVATIPWTERSKIRLSYNII
jgi:hypothetical protein